MVQVAAILRVLVVVCYRANAGKSAIVHLPVTSNSHYLYITMTQYEHNQWERIVIAIDDINIDGRYDDEDHPMNTVNGKNSDDEGNTTHIRLESNRITFNHIDS